MADSDSEPDEFKIVTAKLKNGETINVKRRNIEEDYRVDTCFFDDDYTVAAATGVCVWEGSWFFINYAQDHADVFENKRILELGSGTGLMGLCLAKGTESHVAMTDVPAIVDEMTRMNIAANANQDASLPSADSMAWPGSTAVGNGSATASPLDWTVPSSQQLVGGCDPADCDLIIGAETVWLKELIEPYVTTVVGVLRRHRKQYESSRGAAIQCYMCYRNRGTETSETFATTAELLACFQQHGCQVDVVCEGDSSQVPGKLCTMFEIALADS
eukprot:TRINITY_DN27299_c0_g1_i1.p1 TRINITY_DN27299_c0_g1~~TRINITY_DN27299_c0_g1_i1.p1  ORF type:complete len:273 (+),score=30.34 TRINITY_DN27299_c0_g1_i1:153-971(+)